MDTAVQKGGLLVVEPGVLVRPVGVAEGTPPQVPRKARDDKSDFLGALGHLKGWNLPHTIGGLGIGDRSADMLSGLDAAKAINDVRDDAVVVSTMTPNRYWSGVSERPELDIPVFGAMGKASSVALGIAVARPDRRVMVLDGDGAVLMNLGTLVTIAGQAPANLVHFVFEDGVYYTTGGQPVPGAGTFDLAGMAESAGFPHSFTFEDLEDLVSELPRIAELEGPVFVCLKVFNEVPSLALRGRTGDAMRRVSEALRS